jgi:hypothetical protein
VTVCYYHVITIYPRRTHVLCLTISSRFTSQAGMCSKSIKTGIMKPPTYWICTYRGTCHISLVPVIHHRWYRDANPMLDEQRVIIMSCTVCLRCVGGCLWRACKMRMPRMNARVLMCVMRAPVPSGILTLPIPTLIIILLPDDRPAELGLQGKTSCTVPNLERRRRQSIFRLSNAARVVFHSNGVGPISSQPSA